MSQVTSGIEKCEVFFNKKEGYIDWENEEFESDGIVLQFYCPECNNELDFGEEQAHEFLQEDDKLKELVAEKLEKIKNDKKRKG